MKTIYRVFYLLLLLTVLISTIYGKDNDVVDVMAEGVSSAQDAAMARDQALRDAQRSAVEKGVGVYIDAETQLQNLQVIEDNILSTSQGYLLPGYKILSEGMDSDGMYHLVLSAKVRLGKLSDDLVLLDELHKAGLIKKANNPRIMISIKRETGGSMVASDTAVSNLSEVLASHGLEVVTGVDDDCEILISGRIDVNKGEPLKIGVVTVSPVTAELEVKGVWTGNSSVIFSKVVKSKGANTEVEAIADACKNVGGFLASSILKNIVSDTNKIELQLRGVSYEDFEQLTRNLIRIRGVLNRYTRSYDENSHSIIDIESTGHSWQLVQKLRDMSEFGFVTEAVSRNRITLRKQL
ncbi:MAG: hypothetical protein HOG49_02410 [Candidatus Scalindua sp.]|nr:hypothetical protein [Candidatus Scalindua sp.]